MCRGRRARTLLHLHIQLEGTVLRGSRAGRRFAQKPSILRACVREEDAGERRSRTLLHLHIQLEGTVLCAFASPCMVNVACSLYSQSAYARANPRYLVGVF